MNFILFSIKLIFILISFSKHFHSSAMGSSMPNAGAAFGGANPFGGASPFGGGSPFGGAFDPSGFPGFTPSSNPSNPPNPPKPDLHDDGLD